MTKTIEIVDREIKFLEEQIVKYEIHLFAFPQTNVQNRLEEMKEDLQTLKQIKCELEAWEICKKKSVDIEKLKLSTCLEEYNSCRYKDVHLTDEEFEILKNREDL